jgi:Dinucleotide-utilizing enzymes involved in molybdopterin and thiamine biosynthesis family 2
MIDEEFLNRYSRQIVLKDIGLDGQEMLLKTKVTVAGVGGLGSMVSSLLARIGFGTIHIIDRDVVSLSDLHRQILYDEGDVGVPKVYAAEKKLKQINSKVNIYSHALSVNNFNMIKGIINDSDIIIDGLDNMRARYNLNFMAVTLGKPYVFASAIENYGNLSSIVPGKTPCLNEFYGDFKDRELPTCATTGVNPAIVTSIASLEVNEAINLVLKGSSPFFGKLALLDLSAGSLETVDLKKDPECDVCSMKAKPEIEPFVEISCSKDGFTTVFVNNYVDGLNLETVSRNSRIKVALKNENYIAGFYEDARFTVFSTGYAVFQFKYYDDEIKNRVEKIYELIIGRDHNKKAL